MEVTDSGDNQEAFICAVTYYDETLLQCANRNLWSDIASREASLSFQEENQHFDSFVNAYTGVYILFHIRAFPHIKYSLLDLFCADKKYPVTNVIENCNAQP